MLLLLLLLQKLLVMCGRRTHEPKFAMRQPRKNDLGCEADDDV